MSLADSLWQMKFGSRLVLAPFSRKRELLRTAAEAETIAKADTQAADADTEAEAETPSIAAALGMQANTNSSMARPRRCREDATSQRKPHKRPATLRSTVSRGTLLTASPLIQLSLPS